MSILDSIGNTPLVELRKVNPNPKVRLMAKLEGSNPGGSVKDRIALSMIQDAIEKGALGGGRIILEATSGNTGIGLAMVGASLGYRVKLTMPGCVSLERRRVLEALGASLMLTEDCQGTDGAIREAHRILEEDPEEYFMPNQFENPANIKAHYDTTAPEIWRQTEGDLDVFVAGLGTTGTVMGAGSRLKEYSPSVQVTGVEPVLGHKVQGLKNMQESIVPSIFDPSRLDRRIVVEDDDAFNTTRRLALEEGLFVGMSSGAATFAAMETAKEMEKGTVVVILPDRGDRYLSTNLFTSICAECPP
jgi:cysteine synthase B